MNNTYFFTLADSCIRSFEFWSIIGLFTLRIAANSFAIFFSHAKTAKLPLSFLALHNVKLCTVTDVRMTGQQGLYVVQGRVVQSWVKIPRVSAKFEFRYESLKSKFRLTLFVNKLMNGCSSE